MYINRCLLLGLSEYLHTIIFRFLKVFGVSIVQHIMPHRRSIEMFFTRCLFVDIYLYFVEPLCLYDAFIIREGILTDLKIVVQIQCQSWKVHVIFLVLVVCVCTCLDLFLSITLE